jgi:hypothetical protein
MKGNRVDSKKYCDDLQLNDGDYGLDQNGNWYGKPPGFKFGYANLSKHKVVEHEDKTITVSPSILVQNRFSKWHGFLERGIWRECK